MKPRKFLFTEISDNKVKKTVSKPLPSSTQQARRSNSKTLPLQR